MPFTTLAVGARHKPISIGPDTPEYRSAETDLKRRNPRTSSTQKFVLSYTEQMWNTQPHTDSAHRSFSPQPRESHTQNRPPDSPVGR
ncbi:hypothetical protein WR25_17224 [Diploscapter pachys]|uniref:Uncharacterized protein n=1 Tax=Diploscapter pachys TaxID=2018661 RepID=A0A2A2K010_9BILA|nr:hypothetical protein WR25_17224 [Diploscapter pachys]